MQFLEDLGNVIRPENVSLADIAAAVAVFAIAFPTARLVERLVRNAILRVRRLSSDTAELLARLSRYATLVAMASVALNLVGVNVGWAVGLALIFLLLVVLTLRPLVQNAAAGFVLKSRPSFAVGDEIELLGHTGTVISISARTTVLRTRDGRRVHIPNTEMLDNPIVVHTAFVARRVSIDITVDPHCELGFVTDVLVDAVEAVPEVRAEPPPKVIAGGLRDGALALTVDVWYEPHEQSQRQTIDGAVRAIHSALRKAGIELPPPRLHVESSSPQP